MHYDRRSETDRKRRADRDPPRTRGRLVGSRGNRSPIVAGQSARRPPGSPTPSTTAPETGWHPPPSESSRGSRHSLPVVGRVSTRRTSRGTCVPAPGTVGEGSKTSVDDSGEWTPPDSKTFDRRGPRTGSDSRVSPDTSDISPPTAGDTPLTPFACRLDLSLRTSDDLRGRNLPPVDGRRTRRTPVGPGGLGKGSEGPTRLEVPASHSRPEASGAPTRTRSRHFTTRRRRRLLCPGTRKSTENHRRFDSDASPPPPPPPLLPRKKNSPCMV